MAIIDPTSQLDNSRFIEALNTCGSAYSEQHRVAMYRALLESTLLVPVNRARMGDGGEIDFLVKRNPETGEALLMTFVDAEAMAIYVPAEIPCIGVPATELLKRFCHAPSLTMYVCTTDSHLPISQAEMQKLADGQIPPPQLQGTPSTTTTPTRFEFQALEEPLPPQLYEQLQAALSRHAAVAAVYILKTCEEGSASEFAIGLIFDPLPEMQQGRPIADEIAGIVKPFLPDGEPLVVFPLSAQDGFARQLAETMPACYRRSE